MQKSIITQNPYIKVSPCFNYFAKNTDFIYLSWQCNIASNTANVVKKLNFADMMISSKLLYTRKVSDSSPDINFFVNTKF